jgi:hypothetical protein
MLPMCSVLRPWLALAVILWAGGTASAARVRYHYVPSANGAMTLVPYAASAPGEKITLLGRSPYCVPPPRATCMASYRHPATGCTVTVPLGLPPDTPTIEHRADRVIYNYGSYMVEVTFLADGSVDVTYSNGLLRDI